jgi:hypothetical protein
MKVFNNFSCSAKWIKELKSCIEFAKEEILIHIEPSFPALCDVPIEASICA